MVDAHVIATVAACTVLSVGTLVGISELCAPSFVAGTIAVVTGLAVLLVGTLVVVGIEDISAHAVLADALAALALGAIGAGRA